MWRTTDNASNIIVIRILKSYSDHSFGESIYENNEWMKERGYVIHRSKRRKNLISPDDSKIINMVSLQDSLIMMLGNYYNKTYLNTLDVQKEMFPDREHDDVFCECGKSHLPIEQILLDYFDIRENYEHLEPEEVSIRLTFEDQLLN